MPCITVDIWPESDAVIPLDVDLKGSYAPFATHVHWGRNLINGKVYYYEKKVQRTILLSMRMISR
jgi:hypothetical protein